MLLCEPKGSPRNRLTAREDADLRTLDIHPTQWRRLRDFLNGTYPHVD
jgi:hypothetical protein